MQGGEDKTVKWDTLEHSGVLFPPEYTPHGVKMLYDGKSIDLTREQEEVCTSLRLARLSKPHNHHVCLFIGMSMSIHVSSDAWTLAFVSAPSIGSSMANQCLPLS